MRPMTNTTPRAVMAAAALLAAALAQAASQAPVAAENGMVVTAQHLATRVGVDVLKDGGHAVAQRFRHLQEEVLSIRPQDHAALPEKSANETGKFAPQLKRV